MRIALSIILTFLVLVLGLCAFFAHRAHKSISKAVMYLVCGLIPPVIGNLFIIASPYELLSTIGCYIYFVGMDLVMGALIYFTIEYCGHTKYARLVKTVFWVILALDTIQLLINIGTHHAFTMEAIEYNGVYYRFIPHVGQTIHRVIDYFILGGVLINLVIKTIRTPRIYAEKYLVIIIAMVAVAAWQTFYIFSRTPVDFSMIGFGVFGILVFLLSIYYRPLRLLDRMLATIASGMPEALFFFDKSNHCIWANHRAREFLNISNEELDNALALLRKKLGAFEKEGLNWESNFISLEGEEVESYVIIKNAVIDDKKRVVGSYISIRDNSSEQQTIQRETYNANHDPLTKVLNRAGYDSVMKDKDLSRCFLVLIDIDFFKETNDDYGHIVGDQVLVRFVEILANYFRDEDSICRVGGDEFAVIMDNVDETAPKVVKQKIDQINSVLGTAKDGLPAVSISAGGAFGKDVVSERALFNNADKALYETKANGKHNFTLYKNK